MTSATVLVALAMMGNVPKASKVGNVTKVPPPATALMAPAAPPARISPMISAGDMRNVVGRGTPCAPLNVSPLRRARSAAPYLQTHGCLETWFTKGDKVHSSLVSPRSAQFVITVPVRPCHARLSCEAGRGEARYSGNRSETRTTADQSQGNV